MWRGVVIVFIVILGLIFLFTLSMRKCVNNAEEVIEVIGEVGLKNIVEDIWYGEEDEGNNQ